MLFLRDALETWRMIIQIYFKGELYALSTFLDSPDDPPG